jgi:large subunit ribosomal protein L28
MRHTKRRWNPNIQRVRIVEGGVEKQIYMCTKCIKTRQKTR